MKISKDRLVQIIKEEIDDHTRDLLSRDLTTAGEIGDAGRAIKELKMELEQLKLVLASEELSLGYKGYAASDAPDTSGLQGQIERVQQAIENFEMNRQIDYNDLSQR
tara:strand:+ start:402 stop:722 length:321 start_codon:yes stop_codon:yes gene_type:complete